MNDLPVDAQTGTSEDWGAPTEEFLTRIRELFVVMGKALRAVQLYEENNPVYQRFVNALSEAFKRIWQGTDRLTVTVDEARLLFESHEVYLNANRSDSLAFLMFKDGIREVTFLPGLEGDELERFLAVLHRAKHVGPEGDDLLTMLWEAELQCFRQQFVDLLAEGVSLPEAGEGAEQPQLQRVLEEEVAQEEEEAPAGGPAQAATEGPPPQAVDREGFNPTLYTLDPRDMERLRREVDLEMRRDLRSDVLAALFDRLEESDDLERQSEILGIFRQLLPGFLSRGALEAAASVLQELRRMESTPGVFDEKRRTEVGGLLDAVSAPETIYELVRALEDGSIHPSPQLLGSFLMHLRAGALGPLLRASETVVVRELRPVLQEAVKGIAERYQNVLVGLLEAEDVIVVTGAARLIGRLRVGDAADALAGLLQHELPSVRLVAIEAALSIRASTVAGRLEDALYDEDREVRIAAARALGDLRYRPAAPRFKEIITDRGIKSRDISEKVAFFESYGLLGDESAVALLDKMLNGKGLLGRREPAEIRAAAAQGLGKMSFPEAHTALQRAMGEDEPVVRSAVNRALRSGAEGET